MFDIGWSELLLIAVAALIVVGPKDLPALLRTLGRYVGMIRAHAQDFRTQFEDAIKDSGVDDMRDEMTELYDGVSNSMHDTSTSIKRDMAETKSVLNEAGRTENVATPDAHDQAETRSMTANTMRTTKSATSAEGAGKKQGKEDPTGPASTTASHPGTPDKSEA